MRSHIIHADSIVALRTLAANSVDAVVTDPPYGLAFMGKRWDYDVPSTELWAECLRVLKPGGHLLAFAGTRTQHRMAVRIEDAGFEIRDMIAWVYGSGFPKSHNGPWGGTALKPALEPITMARKPLVGTVEANWLEHGTGALNIDACRVETEDYLGGGAYSASGNRSVSPSLSPTGMNRPGATAGEFVQPIGRWPANLIHDGSDEVLVAFPSAPGQLGPVKLGSEGRKAANVYGEMRRGRGDEPSANSENAGAVGFKMRPGARRLDAGSAARFFYCAKASRADRNEGIGGTDNPAVAMGATMGDRERADWRSRNGNHHPTVKPTNLMRYLCRLITPTGGGGTRPIHGIWLHRQGCCSRGISVHRHRARSGVRGDRSSTDRMGVGVARHLFL